MLPCARDPGPICDFGIARSGFSLHTGPTTKAIKAGFPLIRIAVNDFVHSKVLLIEPRTLYISSANFGQSKMHESAVGLHSKEAHDWYVANRYTRLWETSWEITV